MRYIDSNQLECLTTAHEEAGYQDVEVTMNDQQYKNDNMKYEYQTPVHVSSLVPVQGIREGGTLVTVLGTAFSARSASFNYIHCMFNNSRVLAEYVSSSKLK